MNTQNSDQGDWKKSVLVQFSVKKIVHIPFFLIVYNMFGKTYTIPYNLKYLFVFLITSSKSGNSST